MISTFSLSYFALLSFGVILSLLEQCRGLRWPFVSLIVVSLPALMIWGEGALWTILNLGLAVLVMGIAAYFWRMLLIAVLPQEGSKIMATAPLTASLGLLIVFVFVLAGILAPMIAPFGQAEIVSTAFAPRDAQLILGADQLGRDVFSRIVFGARNSVGLALIATTLAFLGGTTAGLVAAIKGGWVDQLMGRFADLIISVPSLIFALLLLSIFGTHLSVIVCIVAVVYTPRAFRLTRAVAGDVVVLDYIEAAKLRGESTGYLIRREILPNCKAPLVAEFGLEFCFVFLLIASLSFLGLGIQPPLADWGSMVRENATLISFGDTTPLIPAAAIALLTIGVNFVVDWLLHRDSGLKD